MSLGNLSWRAAAALAVAGSGWLMACMNGYVDENGAPGDQDSVPVFLPGSYSGSFGPEFDSLHYESELILDSSGAHRWFMIRDNIALFTSHGQWLVTPGNLELRRQVSSPVASGIFGSIYKEVFWNFQDAPDEQIPLRRVSDTAFERYEASPDGRRLQWVAYRRAAPSRIFPGKFLQSVPDSISWVDTAGDTVVERSWMEYEFFPEGGFLAHGYTDSLPKVEFDAPKAGLRGKFLVADHPGKSFWDDSTRAFGRPDTLGGEWIFRLNNITDSGFQIWDVGSYPEKWKDFRKAP